MQVHPVAHKMPSDATRKRRSRWRTTYGRRRQAVMREFDHGRSFSSAPPVVERHEFPELTPEDKKRDAIAKAERQLNSADLRLGELKNTQDPRVWKAKHESLEKEIATSLEALQEAKKLQADADTLKPIEKKVAALKRGAADAKPPKGFRELTLESEICAALTAKPEGSARDGHDRKEATIRALFERLDVAESRDLIWRIKARLPEDALVVAFHALSKDPATPEPPRQERLKETLDRAGKREAQAAEPARRAEIEARRQAASREISRAVLAPKIDAELDAPVEVEVPTPRPEAASVTNHASAHQTSRALNERDAKDTSRGRTFAFEAPPAASIKVDTLNAKLGEILEASESDGGVETQLLQLFGEFDDFTLREIAQAKHVGDRQQNPWLHPERLPERVRDNILGQLEDEFRRYASVIKDPMTPAKGLRVIVSDVTAKPFFERLMAKHGIPGEVIVQP